MEPGQRKECLRARQTPRLADILRTPGLERTQQVLLHSRWSLGASAHNDRKPIIGISTHIPDMHNKCYMGLVTHAGRAVSTNCVSVCLFIHVLTQWISSIGQGQSNLARRLILAFPHVTVLLEQKDQRLKSRGQKVSKSVLAISSASGFVFISDECNSSHFALFLL